MPPEMQQLLATLPQVGTVNWIGLRPGRRQSVDVVTSVEVSDRGLVGDRFQGPADAPRMVTLIQGEHLQSLASMLGQASIDPAQLRRNLVVTGINLLALKDRAFQIGSAVLIGTGPCPPCSRMEENLGPGGYNAMRGHGGITARVLHSGRIEVGSEVKLYDDATELSVEA